MSSSSTRSSLLRCVMIAIVACGFGLAIGGNAVGEEAPAAAAAAAEKRSAEKVGGPQVNLDAMPAATPPSWDAEGMKAAEALAAKLRAAGIACDQCEQSDYGFYDPKISNRLPDPLAVVSCTGDAEEDITIDIFSTAADALEFVKVKRQYLCHQTASNKLYFYPGFPYVTSETWVIEPDEKATMEAIGKALGGKTGMADCVGFWPTPASKAPPAP